MFVRTRRRPAPARPAPARVQLRSERFTLKLYRDNIYSEIWHNSESCGCAYRSPQVPPYSVLRHTHCWNALLPFISIFLLPIDYSDKSRLWSRCTVLKCGYMLLYLFHEVCWNRCLLLSVWFLLVRLTWL